MGHIFLWLGFIGAWLLFAGPIYQAAIELRGEDIEIDRIRAVGSKIPKTPRVSAWWWLFPPVKFYKEFQNGKQSRVNILKALPREDIEAMIAFNSKAVGWVYVAFGGLCIACKETYELAHYNHWNTVGLLLLIVLMAGLSVANLVYRLKRAESLRHL